MAASIFPQTGLLYVAFGRRSPLVERFRSVFRSTRASMFLVMAFRAASSAPFFRAWPECPLTHFSRVFVSLLRMRATSAFRSSLFPSPIHPGIFICNQASCEDVHDIFEFNSITTRFESLSA
jgi:hypothetical protein